MFDHETFTRDAADMVRANDAARVARLAALMWPYLTRTATALVRADMVEVSR